MSEQVTPEQFRDMAKGKYPFVRGRFRRGVRGGRVAGAKREMNRVERRYAEHLDAEVAAGRVAWYGYEAVTLKLGPDTRWTPDFVVQYPDGEIRLVDTKAWNKKRGKILAAEEDAKVKMRIASAFPFRIFMAAHNGTGWVEAEV